MATKPKTSTEVATIDTSKTDEFTAALQAAGFLNKASGGTDFNRITAKGANLFYNKELIAAYNPVSKEPALIVQLTDAPVEYQSMWFEGPLALAVGRPEVSGRFCKSHFDDPNENREYSEAYNGKRQNCRECPVSPFTRVEDLPAEAKAQQGASKCSWKGDVEFKILTRNAEGQLEANDDTIYTMSLATTGIIEFKGSASRNSNPLAGSISPENFMVQLAKLGIEKWGKDGLLKAHTYLRLGGVIAELHLPLQQSSDGSRTWNIPSFKPIDILEIEDVAKLETSEAPADAGATEDDDVPF